MTRVAARSFFAWTTPMTAAGGAFLAAVGGGLIAYAFAPAPLAGQLLLASFVAGAVLLILSAMRLRALGFRPARSQTMVLYGAIILEVIAMMLLGPLAESERTLWLTALSIVAIHFLPMGYTHGNRMSLLGFACGLVCLAGWLAPAFDLQLLIASDGVLKLIFGLWMASSLLTSISSRTAEAL